MTATGTSEATATDARRVAAERMAEAAGAWLASLDTAQRQKGSLPFESGERERWFYTPTVQAGLSLLDMNPRQQRLAHMLIASGLSQGGYVTATTIMGLENPLHMEERWRDAPFAGEREGTRIRDPLMYYVAVYGEPGGKRWSWHAGGHHVSISYTIVDGVLVSPTPTFFGAHPAEAAGVGPNRIRPLAGEEDIARELLHLFDEERRRRVIISPAAPFDLVQSNRPRVEDNAMTLGLGQIWSFPQDEAMLNAGRRAQERYEGPHSKEDLEALRYRASKPAGIPASEMSSAEREALLALIRQYVYRLPDDVAAYQWGQIEARGIGAIHFAWAGSPEPRQPHYYRLQGPRFLVEYDNVQNNTNHIHSVWRDPGGDHGQDVLAAHYAATPH